MARKENQEPVTGGLTFGKSGEVVTPEVKVAAGPAKTAEVGKETADLKSFYQEKFGTKKGNKDVRKQFTVTQAMNERLRKARKNGEIISENHLVNMLLEKYFNGELALKETE